MHLNVGGISRDCGEAIGGVNWKCLSGFVWLKWESGQERHSEGGVWVGDKKYKNKSAYEKDNKTLIVSWV